MTKRKLIAVCCDKLETFQQYVSDNITINPYNKTINKLSENMIEFSQNNCDYAYKAVICVNDTVGCEFNEIIIDENFRFVDKFEEVANALFNSIATNPALVKKFAERINPHLENKLQL